METKDGFYGAKDAFVPAITHIYPEIGSPRDLYRALKHVWCAETCAPRMRDGWTEENPTLGQCSVTAFLAQDIFGGKVYGIPLEDGGFHCYNVVGDRVFDLTNEQFGSKELSWQNPENPEQFRENHFAREEKRQRYEMLKQGLLEYQKQHGQTLLEIDVVCEEALTVTGFAMKVVMIPFSGSAKGSGFTGMIAGTGVDTQKIGEAGSMQFSARYMLLGTDADGKECRIFVENQGNWETGLTPMLVTDSAALAWMEKTPLCATIDGTPRGVLVRIFRQQPAGAE